MSVIVISTLYIGNTFHLTSHLNVTPPSHLDLGLARSWPGLWRLVVFCSCSWRAWLIITFLRKNLSIPPNSSPAWKSQTEVNRGNLVTFCSQAFDLFTSSCQPEKQRQALYVLFSDICHLTVANSATSCLRIFAP